MLKKLIRELLPSPVVARINRIRLNAKYRGLSSREIYDKVYAEGAWGRDNEGRPTSGSGSHADEIVEPYIRTVAAFLHSLEPPVVVDMGCGDFNVGSRLVPYARAYIACDVSSTILELSSKKYRCSGLEFRNIDLVEDELPRGDVCLIRQVLQHLSNSDIASFVRKIHSQRPYKYLVVTEHLPSGSEFCANVDKASGPGIRLDVGSGVDLARKPFCLMYQRRDELLCLKKESYGRQANIVTTLYELQ